MSTAGPDLVAHYFIKLDYSAIFTFLSRLVFPGVFLWVFLWGFFSLFYPGFHTLIMFISLCLLFIAGIITFMPHRVIQNELRAALEYSHKMLNYKDGQSDIFQIEPRHNSKNPENLLRTAFYYRYKGQKEKGMHYLALLIKQFPKTKEAAIAFEELKSWEGRMAGKEEGGTLTPGVRDQGGEGK